MHSKKCFSTFLCLTAYANAATFSVTNTADSGAGSFRDALNSANASAGSAIQFNVGGEFKLVSGLPPITSNITSIDSNGFLVAIEGNAMQASGFFVLPNHPGLVITNSSGLLSFSISTLSIGGNGGSGAGGGALGAGGGIFVGPNSKVTLKGTTFSNCLAQGGDAETSSPFGIVAGGGGGMLQGNGADYDGDGSGGDGGGFDRLGGGGSGGTQFNFAGSGAFGAGGGGSVLGIQPGSGGFGGGGGGGSASCNPNFCENQPGGVGGFGGGGGGTGGGFGNKKAHSVFGGGTGDPNGGGGGAGLGGAIFVGNGAMLTLQDVFSISNNQVIGGSANGSALGQDIFLMSSGLIDFAFTNPGASLTILSNIESDQGAGGGSTSTNGITMSGVGRLILGGNNSYTGTTSINGGTVSVSSDSNLGSLSNPLSFNGGTLEITSNMTTGRNTTLNGLGGTVLTDTNVIAIFNGTIDGFGSLTKKGPGTLNPTNINLYFGGTNFVEGTISVAIASALGLSIGTLTFDGGSLDVTGTTLFSNNVNLLTDATINVAPGNTAFFTGPVFGPGNLTINGSVVTSAGLGATQGEEQFLLEHGTAVILGPSTHTGKTMVESGKLIVGNTGSITGSFEIIDNAIFHINDGFVTSPITVNSSAILGGRNGRVRNVLVKSGGIWAPGESLGTNTSDGTVLFDTGSIYQPEFDNTDSDLIAIIPPGTFTINPGAILQLKPLNFTAAEVPFYTIVSSTNPTISGQFGTVINPLTRYSFGVVYDPTFIRLVFEGVLPFSAFVSGNAKSVATCFDDLIIDPTLCISEVLQILDLQTPSQMQDSFNQMQPANFNNIAFAEENVAERIRQIYTSHFYNETVCCEGWRLWFAPFLEWVNQRGHGNLPGYREKFGGVTVAADYQWPEWTLTGGFSFAVADLDHKTEADFLTYAGSLATAWTDTCWFADAVFSYLYSPIHASRKMLFSVDNYVLDASFKAKAKHHENSNQLLGHIGGGYNFEVTCCPCSTFNFYPFANLDYIWMTNDGYREHGARCMDLKVKSKQYDYLRPEAGVGMGYIACLEEIDVAFDVSASYVHEFRFQGKKTKSRFEGNSCAFTVKGLKPENNLICPSAKLCLSPKDDAYAFTFGYHGEYGEHFTLNAGEIEFRKAF